MRLDKLDAGVLRLLQGNARLSFRDLAKELGTTTPTVAARVRALEDLGVIKAYRAELDLNLLGGTPYVVTLRARPAALQKVAEALLAAPWAEEVLLLAGSVLCLRARIRPPQTLGDLHAAVAAVEDVNSYDVAEVLAAPHRLAVHPIPEGVDLSCHQCGGPIHGEPVRGKLDGRVHVFCCHQCLEAFRSRYEKVAAKAPRHRPPAGARGPRGAAR